MLITADYRRNYYLNGVEIYFSADPGYQIKNKMMAKNWRYNGSKKCWYIYYTEANLNFAKQICDSVRHRNSKEKESNVYQFESYSVKKEANCTRNEETYKKCAGNPIIPMERPIGRYVPISPKDERYYKKRSFFS